MIAITLKGTPRGQTRGNVLSVPVQFAGTVSPERERSPRCLGAHVTGWMTPA